MTNSLDIESQSRSDLVYFQHSCPPSQCSVDNYIGVSNRSRPGSNEDKRKHHLIDPPAKQGVQYKSRMQSRYPSTTLQKFEDKSEPQQSIDYLSIPSPRPRLHETDQAQRKGMAAACRGREYSPCHRAASVKDLAIYYRKKKQSIFRVI